jgi:hypothetical protein
MQTSSTKPRHELGQTWFVKRHDPAREQVDACRLAIDASDRVAEVSETRAGHEADVTGPDYRDVHV